MNHTMAIRAQRDYFLKSILDFSLQIFILKSNNRLYMMNLNKTFSKFSIRRFKVELTCETNNSAFNCIVLQS